LKDAAVDKEHRVVFAVEETGEMNQHHFKRTGLQQRHLNTQTTQSINQSINQFIHSSIPVA